MSLLLTEDSDFLTTESGNHLLIEPIDIPSGPSAGQSRSGGEWIAIASDVGYLVETGGGKFKIQDLSMLKLDAKNAGATVRFL